MTGGWQAGRSEPLKLKLITEFEREFKLTLELRDSPLPVGFNVSVKGCDQVTGFVKGRFATTAPNFATTAPNFAARASACMRVQHARTLSQNWSCA